MDDEDPSHGRQSAARWRPDHWSLRTKISTVLLLPVLVALALADVRIQAELGQASALSALSDQLPVLQSTADLVGLANGQLVDAVVSPDSAALTAGSAEVRAKTTDLQQQANFANLATDTAGNLNTILGQLTALGAAGGEATGNTTSGTAGTKDAVAETTTYHDILFALSGIVPALVAAGGNTDLTAAADTTSSVLQLGTDLAVEQTLLRAIPAGPANVVAAGRAATEDAVLTSQIQRDIDPAFGARFTAATASAAPRLSALESALVNGHDADPAALLGPLVAESTAIGGLLTSLVSSLSAGVTALSEQARSAALRDTALVLGALLGALAIALLVARSLVFPVRRLHAAAIDAAQHVLPDTIARMQAGEEVDWRTMVPVAVHGHEEIGQLARAFDDMQGQALRLAGEQAELRNQVSEMFMTLSRRSQSLVESQLSVIDRLEADEQDPQRLEDLFRVDHLATRLRRNGENLQVLAGGQPVRHDHGPMTAVELLRAATSEVKDYRRISLGNVPSGSVRAPASEDVVHILAELLDNATRFSNPAEKVLLTADRGADGGLLVEVVDTGLGMTAEDIESSNSRLAVADAVSPETTRRMGLFVVGRLAAQHGVTVRLRRTTTRTNQPGITASVHVPGDLVVTESPTADPWPLRPGTSRAGSTSANGVAVTNGAAVHDGGATTNGQARDTGGIIGAIWPSQRSNTATPPAEPASWPPPATPTPIFDRMASRWFAGADGAAGAADNADTADSSDMAGNAETADKADAVEVPEQPAVPEPQAAEAVDLWAAASPADEVLRSATNAIQISGELDYTPAGLPTRTPGAHLAPGAAAVRTQQKPAPANGFRDPDAVRDNLARHYNGMRAARRSTTTPPRPREETR